MASTVDIEHRIKSALERIDTASQALALAARNNDKKAHEDTSDDRTKAPLAEALHRNAQLQEHVKTLKAQLDKTLIARDQQSDVLRDKLADLVSESARLKDANKALSQVNESLRQENAQGISNAELMNTALKSQLEALQAARALETAELEALLADLSNVLGIKTPSGDTPSA